MLYNADRIFFKLGGNNFGEFFPLCYRAGKKESKKNYAEKSFYHDKQIVDLNGWLLNTILPQTQSFSSLSEAFIYANVAGNDTSKTLLK